MRGALLIAAAVLLGAGLLANGFRDDDSVASGSGVDADHHRSTTAARHDASTVAASARPGAGEGARAERLGQVRRRQGRRRISSPAANYTVLDPGNANGGTVTASIVYFVPGYDADAGSDRREARSAGERRATAAQPAAAVGR